jgi:hypothetical protein
MEWCDFLVGSISTNASATYWREGGSLGRYKAALWNSYDFESPSFMLFIKTQTCLSTLQDYLLGLY